MSQEEIQTFETLVQDFNEVTPEEAEALLESGDGNILFIGRETCPFCRKFIVTLHEAANQADLVINFLHSQKEEHEEETQKLRDKYGVPTVPGLLYGAKDGVKVVCDSSLSVEDILSFVEA